MCKNQLISVAIDYAIESWPMPTFNLVTTWKIPSPIETCWFSIIDIEAWPSWWKYVDEATELEQGDSNGINSKYQYKWSTCLPYHLNFKLCVTQLIPYQLISFNITGDLEGSGCCKLSQHNQYTHIQFEWNVQTSRPWMTRIAHFAQPIFKWNHRQVMRSGEQSFIRRLNSSA